VASGDAFPHADDLVEAAARLERLGRAAARRLRLVEDRDLRRQVRGQLGRAYRCGQALRAAEPSSADARLALKNALDLERGMAAAMGDDPLPEIATERLGLDRPELQPLIERLEPPDPVRLPWPLIYDLDGIYRIGGIGRAAYRIATRLDEMAEALELRAREAAALLPEQERPREPVVDMDEMELAKAKSARPPGWEAP